MRVNFQNLAAAKEELAGKEQSLNREIKELDSLCAELKSETALTTYQKPARDLIESLEAERRSLRSMVRALEQILTIYSRCESNVTRIMTDGANAKAPQMTVQNKPIQFDADVLK